MDLTKAFGRSQLIFTDAVISELVINYTIVQSEEGLGRLLILLTH
jgi:hypothetical protein